MPKGGTTRGANITRVRNPGTRASAMPVRSATRAAPPGQSDAARNIVRSRRGSELGPDVDVEEMQEELESENPGPRQRISLLTAFGLTFLSILFDVAEFGIDMIGTAAGGIFVVVGLVLTVFSFFFWPLLFWLLGVPIWKGRNACKKIATQVTTILVEAVPWVGAFLPGTTIGTIVTIMFTWYEDKGKNAKREVMRNIVRARRFARRRMQNK